MNKQITFKKITREEYEGIKNEIKKRFCFATIRRNNQQYAMGGFSLSPKDYDNGFTSEQIDKLCIFLKSSNIDDQSLNVISEEVYGEDKGDFAGKKIKYMIFNSGFSFLMRVEGQE